MSPANEVRFGLLGRTLGHSWSPQIHARLGSTPYVLVEREPADARTFVREGDWSGLNVTIPYKRLAAEASDEVSPRVQRLGVANTLVHRDDGSIFAENTDVLGFSWMLRQFAQSSWGSTAAQALDERKVLVLGSGGACQAVRAALEDAARCTVRVISRTGDDTYDNLLERHGDAALVVNTTPVGMYPNCPATPLASEILAKLPQLMGVLDVVYNPERTGICLAAEELGIPYQSGLGMLVAQAFYASQLFQGTDLDEGLISKLTDDIRASQRNIVLIGMPGAGKTTTGRALARMVGRPFIDLDDVFAVETGVDASGFITQYGERAFRERETEVARRYGAQSGLVIACGGGIVTQQRNYALLHQNATICFIDRPLHELSSSGRPLSQTRGVLQLALERMDLYRSWADLAISCTGTASGDAMLLKAKLGL